MTAATPDEGDVQRVAEVNAVAMVLIDGWEAAEGKPVNVSYIATHADMARAILASNWLGARDARVAAEARAAAFAALPGLLREDSPAGQALRDHLGFETDRGWGHMEGSFLVHGMGTEHRQYRCYTGWEPVP